MVYECNTIWNPRSHVSISNISLKFEVNPMNSAREAEGVCLFRLQPLDLQTSDCSRDARDRAALGSLLSQPVVSLISKSTNEGLKCNQLSIQ